jgi:hypothetical protein
MTSAGAGCTVRLNGWEWLDPAIRSTVWNELLDPEVRRLADNVIAYTDGLDQNHFVQSGLNYDATLRASLN